MEGDVDTRAELKDRRPVKYMKELSRIKSGYNWGGNWDDCSRPMTNSTPNIRVSTLLYQDKRPCPQDKCGRSPWFRSPLNLNSAVYRWACSSSLYVWPTEILDASIICILERQHADAIYRFVLDDIGLMTEFRLAFMWNSLLMDCI